MVDGNWIGKSCKLLQGGVVLTTSARSGFDSLRRIHQQDPQLLKDMEIYLDGGVRRGSEVLMAVALGARGVGLGRPFLFAQAAYGEKGAIRAVRSEFFPLFRFTYPNVSVMESEIVTAMQLMGVRNLEELRPEMVECLQDFWK
jgi:L-lactate dehydrogenase (cytochrome)